MKLKGSRELRTLYAVRGPLGLYIGQTNNFKGDPRGRVLDQLGVPRIKLFTFWATIRRAQIAEDIIIIGLRRQGVIVVNKTNAENAANNMSLRSVAAKRGYRRWLRTKPDEIRKNGRKLAGWIKRHPKLARKNGRKVAIWHLQHPKIRRKNGLKTGPKNGRKLAMWNRDHPEALRKGACKMNHIRWHIARSISNPHCQLCRGA